MRYSKENYERVDHELENAATNSAESPQRFERASEFEKLADLTYQQVVSAFGYLRGGSAERVSKKLGKLYEHAHQEALDLQSQHELLIGKVETAWSSFISSVDRLKRFESELLGK